jgi:ribose transport system substrate-binding protein
VKSEGLKRLVWLSAACMAGWAYTGAAQAADLAAQAKAELDGYRVQPTFTPAGDPFDAKACMKGKKILSVPASSAIPFLKTINTSMAKIAGEVGFTFQANFGVNNKFDLIDLLAGTDPRSLEPQIKAAKDAGIKVIAAHLTGFEQPLPGAVSGVVPIDYKRAGELLAWQAIAGAGEKANALVLVSNEALSTDSMVAGIKSVFDTHCPTCKYKIVNVPIPDWSTKVQPNVQSAVLADPTLNYVLPIYDSMAQFVVPALTITGKASQVKVATFNGTPFVIGLIQKGQVQSDIGENLDWIAHGVIDAEMRILCGLPAVKDPKIPFLVFDAANAATAGTPPQASTGYGNAYVAGYRALWKLQ